MMTVILPIWTILPNLNQNNHERLRSSFLREHSRSFFVSGRRKNGCVGLGERLVAGCVPLMELLGVLNQGDAGTPLCDPRVAPVAAAASHI